MSDSVELKTVVERLLRENNVKLKRLFQSVLQTIAGEFWAAGLIEQEVADSMLVLGVAEFTLATRLFNACQTSLVVHPGKKFLKFIEVLKGYDTMKLLAKEMESEFEQARESYFNDLAATHLAGLFKRTCSKPKIALLCVFVNGNRMHVRLYTDDEREDCVASTAYISVDTDVNIRVSACITYIHKCPHNMHVRCSNGEVCPLPEPHAMLENCASMLGL